VSGAAWRLGVDLNSNVTIIGDTAFARCTNQGSISIPNTVTAIADNTFEYCSALTGIIIPNSVTSIESSAFQNSPVLTSTTIGSGVTNIGTSAFAACSKLKAVCFQGNAPGNGSDSTVFPGDNSAMVYYLPGATGWHSLFDSETAFLWNPRAASGDASLGVRTNRFGCNIIGSISLTLVAEACTNTFKPVWSPVSTNVLNSPTGVNRASYFSEPQWTNYPGPFYRLRFP
jgi:hypothetical protein